MATKYIEELSFGDSFEFDGIIYILSSDFKKNGDRMALSTNNGQSRWLNSSVIVNSCELYTMDKDNNIIALKPKEKENVANKTQDLS